jgi:hypothetical protein
MTDPTTSKKSKSWYKRKRFWFFVIFVFLFYFCLVPSPARISVEAIGFTESLTVDGEVDYFSIVERTYIDKLSPPENNGQRLLFAAFGPRVLEQSSLADLLQWEEIPTHKSGKTWFEKQWIPLCEHLYIDPYRKPMFYDKLGFRSYMDKYFDEQDKTTPNKSTTNHFNKIDELFKKLTSASWQREDYPEVGKWLDEYSEVFDYFGMCVRKPNFVSWRQRPKNDDLMAISLSNTPANRQFASNLQIRVMERIGRGDIEGALYDAMSMKYLASHYRQSSFLVENYTGITVNDIANKSIKKILTNCSLNEEQLEKFNNDLDNLPKSDSFTLSLKLEQLIAIQMLKTIKDKELRNIMINFNYPNDSTILHIIWGLPFDANIAYNHLMKLYNERDLQGNKHLTNNPILRQQYIQRLKKSIQKTSEIITTSYISTSDAGNIKKLLHKIPLIRIRSKLVAECIFAMHATYLVSMCSALERCEASDEMLRIAISLERYKLANGKYPQNLEALVPKYLDMMPIDPCTGRTTFVYKLRETTTENTTEETPKLKELPYILYSLGSNAKDDGGIPYKGSYSQDYDLVF